MTWTGLLLAGLATTAQALTGGPDAAGYVFVDSNEPGGPAYTFDDISGTGSLSAVTNIDDSFEFLPVGGFSFPYYGAVRTSFGFQTNGAVNFANTSMSLSNFCMPTGLAADTVFIAAFWDDLNPASGGDMYFQLKGSPGANHRLILQWEGVYRYGTYDPVTVQVVLYEDGVFDIAYESVVASTSSVTIGAQGAAAVGLQYACDTAGSVTSGRLIRFLPPSVDGDGDGFDAIAAGGTDCDDTDPAIYPGAIEACDGVDQSCDGVVPPIESDDDGDGYRRCEDDCDDGDTSIYPGAPETAGDGIDQDCDGVDTPAGTGGGTGSGTGTGGTGTGTGGGTGSGSGGGTGSGTGSGTGTGTGTGTGAPTTEYAKLGCGCATGAPPVPGAVGGLTGLAWLALRRRRPA